MERLTARRAACDVLVRVMHHDSYANLCVKKTAPKLADERERALFAALVYGVLEKLVHLECALSSLCRMKKLPPETVEALYLGAYQILFLDGVPKSAAVSESVALVRRKSPRLAGMANAVLRNAARQKETLLAIPSGIEGVMRRMNLPSELAEKWIECYGEGETPLPRKTGVRLRDVNKRGEVSAFLLENADVCEPYGDDCFVVQGAGDLTQSALYRTGAFVIQSVTSRLCAKAVGTKPGMRVLDCCAAPGGKSFAMADEMQDNGRIDALDLHEHRIKLIENEARRLDLSIVHARRADASELPDELAQRYDAVLCDAPCSGLAAAGQPEIALRTTQSDIDALAALQHDILSSAARCVKPGGVLLYSTCTWTREEDERQAERFLAEHPEFAPGALEEHVPLALAAHVKDGFLLRFDPARDGLSPFFMARFVRR